MELTQEGKEIIRKRDRSSSVEPGGQRQNKITKPLQGEKRDLRVLIVVILNRPGRRPGR
jgi:hypothetical protein